MNVDLEKGFRAYKKYVALKNHFQSNSYDYFKYKGAVNISYNTFLKRNDKYFFCKLANKPDIENYIVANLLDDCSKWIGEIVEQKSESIYRNWVGRQQALEYKFKNDIRMFPEDFNSVLTVVDGQHPLLLKKTLRNEVMVETTIILNNLVPFFDYWSKKINDEYIWPKERTKLQKYAPFVKFNSKRFKQIVVDVVQEKLDDK